VLEVWDAHEVQPPSTIPPARRIVPRLVYVKNYTPSSEVEEWLAGLVCDVLLQIGPCDDNRLRQILLTPLPENFPHVEVLKDWVVPVSTERWAHICDWLHKLLGVPITMPLSIRNPQALTEVIGDHRTESLALALIEARRQREIALEKALADSGSTSEAQPDNWRKHG
jgi:hypothetical protein